VVNPCSNHGICRPLTGTCVCDPDWNGDLQCSTCTPGWTGADCSVAITNNQDLFLPVWTVFGEGHFTALSGKSFDFSGIGVYALSISPDGQFVVSSNQVACQYSTMSCSQAVSVSINGHVIIIEAPSLINGNAIITVDGVPVLPYEAVEVPAGSGYFLMQASQNSFEVTGVDSLVLSVTINGRFLNINCQVSRDYCAKSTGVMGSCSGSSNSKTLPQYTGAYATCSVYGQSHYTTFDKYSYTFPGECSYTMTNVVLGNNSDFGFTVIVSQDSCLSSYCVGDVTVLVPGLDPIKFATDGSVFVGTMSVVSYPLRLINANTIDRSPYGTVLQIFSSIALVTYTGTGTVIVQVANDTFFHATSGLCGNYNHNSSDDLSSMSPWAFGLSWATTLSGSVACSDSPTPPTPICNSLSFAQQYCHTLANGSAYQTCRSVVPVDTFVSSCLSDACNVPSSLNGIQLACQSYKNYDRACYNAEVQGISSIVDSCGVCFGDGSTCASQQATCQAFGSVSFSTFDGKQATFNGACDYELAKDCSQDDFDVQIRMGTCGAGKCVRNVGIQTAGAYTVQLNANGLVIVGGVILSAPMPVTLGDGTRISGFNGGIVVTLPTIGVTVTWQFVGAVSVSVPDFYANRMCGLCGNYNGLASDDFNVTTVVPVDVVWTYGTSYKVGVYSQLIAANGNLSCSDGPRAPPPCDSSTLPASLLSLCSSLRNSNGPYGTCFATINPSAFYQQCLAAVCAPIGWRGRAVCRHCPRRV